MTIKTFRKLGPSAALAGLLASAAAGGCGRPISGARAPDAERTVASWPEPSRTMALAMIEKHGQPSSVESDSLTWIGLYRGRRTVAHRSSSGEGMIEQVVLYRVPPGSVGELARFDDRLRIDEEASELSARTDSVRSSFLVLNLAHEIASGFKSASEAREFRDRQERLARAGKSSPYRDGLLFERPVPSRPGESVLPGPAGAP